MKRIFIILLIITPFGFISYGQQTKQEQKVETSETPKEENPYLSLYSGTYDVQVGVDTVKYVGRFELYKSGSVDWSEPIGQFTLGGSGTWTANEGEIIILDRNRYKEETFKLQEETFVSTITPDRYLVKR